MRLRGGGVFRAEGPGTQPKNSLSPCKGRNKSACDVSIGTCDRGALTGLENLWAFRPGLQPGLSNGGPSALKTSQRSALHRRYLTPDTSHLTPQITASLPDKTAAQNSLRPNPRIQRGRSCLTSCCPRVSM